MVTDKAILLAGPTGGGKSAFALEFAKANGLAIVNADSMQVYRDLRVLTACPTPADEARVPHYLYGVLSGEDRCSAGRWLQLVAGALGEIRAAGRVPIFVGGTGLYFKSLTEGLAPVPQIPPDVKQQAAELSTQLEPDEFHHRLAERDPEMARRLRPSDGQRVRRAWEVIEATGLSLAEWQTRSPDGPPVLEAQNTKRIILDVPRETIYARCDARFDTMIEQGALAEVEALLAQNLDPELPIMKALGVPELQAYLEGRLSLDQAIERAKTATRRYAKRQTTWFRHQMPGWHMIGTQQMERYLEEIIPFIRKT
ncbi:MAG: tRNA (adenosine(37)-N6)-dimethylallyltransferase MiaA [Rhodospirillales bacterium]|nr:tRNA (adenosine(37)-N6)-dimethylallyltransferase MiaA [Rhodospirillales bacterium]